MYFSDSEDDVDHGVLETPAFDTYSLNSANDVDDSILERSAFDIYSINTDNDPNVPPDQPLCTSNTTPQKTNDEEYENYCEILDDTFSDDDPELLEAIEASLSELAKQQQTQGEGSVLENEEDSLKSLLGSFQNNNLDLTEWEKNGSITISRKAIFSSAQRAIARKKFSFLKPVYVTFAGEEAVDEGGPKREFFCLLMRAICESSIFHGSWFSYDLGLLADKYQLAGKLVAWSVLHGEMVPVACHRLGMIFKEVLLLATKLQLNQCLTMK